MPRTKGQFYRLHQSATLPCFQIAKPLGSAQESENPCYKAAASVPSTSFAIRPDYADGRIRAQCAAETRSTGRALSPHRSLHSIATGSTAFEAPLTKLSRPEFFPHLAVPPAAAASVNGERDRARSLSP